jgi:hypothetical protein
MNCIVGIVYLKEVHPLGVMLAPTSQRSPSVYPYVRSPKHYDVLTPRGTRSG